MRVRPGLLHLQAPGTRGSRRAAEGKVPSSNGKTLDAGGPGDGAGGSPANSLLAFTIGLRLSVLLT